VAGTKSFRRYSTFAISKVCLNVSETDLKLVQVPTTPIAERRTSMALCNYGLLIGKITGIRETQGRKPHWLLMVQPGDSTHPSYRVALNLPAVQPTGHSEIEYQIVTFKDNDPLPIELRRLGGKRGTGSLLLADGKVAIPRLSYTDEKNLREWKHLDKWGFPSEPRRARKSPPPQKLDLLRQTIRDAGRENALVAVFGTGAPTDHRTGISPATGFTGIDNVHMNQGAFNRTGGTPHYFENGPEQDGGIVILSDSGAKGVFIKFRSQTVQTDAQGRPTITRIPEIDSVPARVRRAILTRIPGESLRPVGAAVAPARPAPRTPGIQNPNGYVFADFDPNDATGKFIPDDDSTERNSPYAVQQSQGTTRGRVPVPRANPVMTLESVVGKNPPGYASDNTGESIAFDVIGDSGAPSQQKLAGYETKVADLMARDAAASPPAFMFHVGDVVYFYGEEDYYYSQFYDPFRAYPAPIFAVPGNHDGITYNQSMVSLAAFQQAFCAEKPGRWSGSGGILRTAMTQPGVYFTLDAPLVSIIGLYSNCGESLGFLDAQQLQFLYQELVRLKALRKNGLPAVLLAIHHFPRWFPGQKDPTSDAIDAACNKAGFWPDAVICGHAHLYQRVIRPNAGKNGHNMPYVLSGSGGYGITPSEEEGKQYMQKIGVKNDMSNDQGSVFFEPGYVRATVTNPSKGDATIKFEYRSVKPLSSGPDDSCVVNLGSSPYANG
jgi:uncharacterized protein YukJ